MSPARSPRKKPAAKPVPDAEIIEHVQRPPAIETPYEYADPDENKIGLGATGDNNETPECLLCFAHGGGGHGSNCPNAGQDPADWVTELPDGWTGPGRP